MRVRARRRRRTFTQLKTKTEVEGPHKPTAEIGSDSVAEIPAALNQLLADVFALYVKSKNFYWHVTGRHFRDYHCSSTNTPGNLNVFVLIGQLFEKVPVLKGMAPTQFEPPFKITQLIVLALFIVLAITASIRFRDAQVRSA